MNIEMIPINKLNPSSYNPRKISKEQLIALVKSITEFGVVEPIVVNKDMTVIGGHQRLDAMLRLKMNAAPCFVIDIPKTKEIALNLALNRISGEWDTEKLAMAIDQLKDLPELDLTGFDSAEIDKIIADFSKGMIEEDEVPEPPKKPKSKRGELYSLGDHLLMCGDSTDASDVAHLMDGQKADMVLTDPPYGIKLVKNGMVGANFGIAKKGEFKPIIGGGDITIAKKTYGIIKNMSNKIVIFGGNYFLSFLPPSDGWIIWDKRGDTGIRNTFADGEMAWCNFHTPLRIYKQLWNGMIREGEHDKRLHPTQKPIKILSEIIIDLTERGDIVVDLFCGSGSTLIAAEKTGRICRMMEIDPAYCDVIRERYANFVKKQTPLDK